MHLQIMVKKRLPIPFEQVKATLELEWIDIVSHKLKRFLPCIWTEDNGEKLKNIF